MSIKEITDLLRKEVAIRSTDLMSWEISVMVNERAEEFTPDQVKKFFEIVDEAKKRVMKEYEKVV